MDNLAGVSAFVQAAETLSFVDAGRVLGISASAVGKSIARLENRLGVRLFHRSTRSMTLTAEGRRFLLRCQRILEEMAAAERDISDTHSAPRGKLPVSLPLVGGLLNPVLAEFVRNYPDIELEADFSDRRVDVVEEGFDAVIRVGETEDSRLMSRQLGTFHLQLVAAPDYLHRAGIPLQPADLHGHAGLLYKFPSTGKVEPWPLEGWEKRIETLAHRLVCNTVDTLIYLAESGQGIACLPDFAVKRALEQGRLQQILREHCRHSGSFKVLWPSSKHLTPKLRVFIDTLSGRLFRD
ncbi:LysR family transcriptional regulator [Serratia sp. OLHL2]|uniref:LysR family transcriptional regulator n=1 Tax=unclassified Serratia (in: enterobacteria) TaxID=2647522 RepID=UPI000C183A3B|nr:MULTISPECIES: LysR family transcriptional regulator [unclassified Serratia (in: enterobacteria)]PII50828.1 LysR family transcriptional regulator [Serratia sp. OLEL1]PII59314.1 LysR family transcriptional regulator [Serratia sp. OLCL1]PII65489.1 LysR family transcriptional regulator [Serratia sp. OLBL1]PII67955.1 LysR family transcriptional regulator [Serratia sp. OLHL2]PII72532.1 LysR family transcriptional regulator [Serratia sp. OLDL1]